MVAAALAEPPVENDFGGPSSQYGPPSQNGRHNGNGYSHGNENGHGHGAPSSQYGVPFGGNGNGQDADVSHPNLVQVKCSIKCFVPTNFRLLDY